MALVTDPMRITSDTLSRNEKASLRVVEGNVFDHWEMIMTMGLNVGSKIAFVDERSQCFFCDSFLFGAVVLVEIFCLFGSIFNDELGEL